MLSVSLEQSYAPSQSGSLLFIFQKVAYAQTWRTDLCLPRGRGLGEGWIGSLGLTDANYYIEKCIKEIPVVGILQKPNYSKLSRSSKENLRSYQTQEEPKETWQLNVM